MADDEIVPGGPNTINQSAFDPTDAASTELEHDEKLGIIPSWITHRHELNEAEQENIVIGSVWAYRQNRRSIITILDEDFMRALHKRMFGRVWRWAGKFRDTERNIGMAPYQITTDLRNLIDDTKVWIGQFTYSPEEILARFYHRLVAIQPFPNGNGRHARLLTDLLAVRLGVEPLTWGSGNQTTIDELRNRYIGALQQADRGRVKALIDFIRS